jgi:hypothetical protein
MAEDVDKLLSEYIAEHRAGGTANPRAYLDRASEADRPELAELLDAYLARSPGREWDAAAYTGSAAERVAESVGRSLAGASGLWPAILPRLRHQARLTRAEVVARLSAALGAGGKEEKVGSYYHEMERGELDSRRVSERVLAALGEIYGTTAEKLREIGEPLGITSPPTGGAPAPAMMRKATPDAAYSIASEKIERSEPVAPAEEWDEIDEMFTGGP